MPEMFILLIFPAAMAFSAAMDLFTMTISNRISIGLVLGFFLSAFVIGMPGDQILLHLGAGLAMLVIGFLMYLPGWIGGGDAKLFASTALWLGWGVLFDYVLLATLAGGVLTLALLFVRTIPLPGMIVRQDWAARLHEPRGKIPYGIALAAAGLAVYPSTVWMAGL